MILLSTNWSLSPYLNSNKLWFEIVSYFVKMAFEIHRLLDLLGPDYLQSKLHILFDGGKVGGRGW